MKRPFKKILVANRGEIAVRVMRTCREMGIRTVAIYSDPDRASLHVRYAGEAYRVGPAPSRESYLRIDKIVEIARASGAEAVHPGYGFLSENPDFARALEEAGLVLIGPPAESMEAMGEKTRARRQMIAAGVPVVPGTEDPIEDEAQALEYARSIGFPVMLKAAAGGGGKGMRKVDTEEAFPSAWRGARREAASSFSDDRVYIEKFLDKPRHVEIQVLADAHGTVIHLGERECSVQRRHQKVIEETPSPIVDAEMRARMGEVARQAARAVGYVGAGTVEFLVDADRNFYFLEMNTRLQVEHPITEMVNDGVDLVRHQILIAGGEKLSLQQEEIAPRGHAIEARIYAEDPDRNFMPTPGAITYIRQPGGPGIRVDSGVYSGWTVPMYYDPMIAKLCARGPDRETAIARLDRALSEYLIAGITTNIGWLRRVLAQPQFVSGDYDTGFLDQAQEAIAASMKGGKEEVALIAAAIASYDRQRRLAVRSTFSPSEHSGSKWKLLGRLRTLGRGV
ncbi:MAG: acetyl-CoA carboxylase biotin carboxylase subunit [Deltaproteobacteria bacterium]|nr:MAG: acetyl-CoA carboxylase biotin carboxylase subunit [Deltaproteobacteria bacterium]